MQCPDALRHLKEEKKGSKNTGELADYRTLVARAVLDHKKGKKERKNGSRISRHTRGNREKKKKVKEPRVRDSAARKKFKRRVAVRDLIIVSYS